MILEHLEVLESKEGILKKQVSGDLSKVHRSKVKANGQSWNNLSNQINKLVLDYS